MKGTFILFFLPRGMPVYSFCTFSSHLNITPLFILIDFNSFHQVCYSKALQVSWSVSFRTRPPPTTKLEDLEDTIVVLHLSLSAFFIIIISR